MTLTKTIRLLGSKKICHFSIFQLIFRVFQVFVVQNIYKSANDVTIFRQAVNFNFTTRRSGPELLCEKRVLKNFAKFTGKNLCISLFLNNIAGLQLY